jgi:WD40 repeat protein
VIELVGATSCAAPGTLIVWDGDLDKLIGRLPVPLDTRAVAVSAAGTRIATTHLDGAVRVWDTDRLQLLLTLNDDDQHAGGIAFTADGTSWQGVQRAASR